MTGLQLMLAAGGMVGAGLALILARLVPAAPDLAEALTRLSPAGTRAAARRARKGTSKDADVRDVLGSLGHRVLPERVWGRVSTQDLAVLRMTRERFYGEKLLFAFIGLVIGPLLTVVPMVFWSGLPVSGSRISTMVCGNAGPAEFSFTGVRPSSGLLVMMGDASVRP